MPEASLLEILRCPETMQRVRVMTSTELETCNQRIVAGEVVIKNGALRAEILLAGLIREDEKLVFPVIDGIPVMLLEEALVLG